MTRLEALAPDIVVKLQNASAHKQRAAILAACEFAVSRSHIDDPSVQEALETMRRSESLSETMARQLEASMLHLDEQYFDLQEAAEEERAMPDEYLQKFSQARAVSAVLSAFKENLFDAATETIYEASNVTDNHSELFALVEARLL